MKKNILKTIIIPGVLTAAFILGGVSAGRPMPLLMNPNMLKVQAEETEVNNDALSQIQNLIDEGNNKAKGSSYISTPEALLWCIHVNNFNSTYEGKYKEKISQICSNAISNGEIYYKNANLIIAYLTDYKENINSYKINNIQTLIDEGNNKAKGSSYISTPDALLWCIHLINFDELYKNSNYHDDIIQKCNNAISNGEIYYKNANSILAYLIDYQENNTTNDTTNTIEKIILNINKPENATENVKINGEEVTADALTITYSKGMTLPQDVKCKGYTFKGWYYGDVNISGNASLSVSGSSDSITVDGKWEEGEPEEVKDSFVITLNANGGTVTPEQITVKKDSNETITLPIPKREGYIFDGWYIGEEKVTSNTPLTEDITFVANWTKDNKYTLTFNADGGKLTLTELQFRENENIISPTPAKLGYEFIGWYVGDEKLKDTYTYGKDVEAKAKWEPKTYTITYENVDGWENPSPTSYKYGDAVTLIAPTKEGFVFDGWYEKISNQRATGIGAGSAIDYIFVAKWHEDTKTLPEATITLTFDTDGGSKINPMNVSLEESVLLPIPTKEGYDFDGWYILGVKASAIQTFNTNTTLVAHWTKQETSNKTDEEKQTEILNEAKEVLKTFTVDGIVVKADSSIELPKGTIAAKDGQVITIPENGILTLSEGKYAIALPGVSDPYVFTVANSVSENNSKTNIKTDTESKQPDSTKYSVSVLDNGLSDNTATSNEENKKLLEKAKNDLASYKDNGIHIGDKLTLPEGTNVTRDDVTIDVSDKILTFDKEGTYVINLPDGTKYTITIKVATLNLSKVTGLKTTAKKKKAVLKYKKIADATGYEIQISTKKSFKSIKVYTTKKNSYTIKKLKKGKKYYIRVRAYKKSSDGTIAYGKWSTIKRTKKIK